MCDHKTLEIVSILVQEVSHLYEQMGERVLILNLDRMALRESLITCCCLLDLDIATSVNEAVEYIKPFFPIALNLSSDHPHIIRFLEAFDQKSVLGSSSQKIKRASKRIHSIRSLPHSLFSEGDCQDLLIDSFDKASRLLRRLKQISCISLIFSISHLTFHS